MWFKFLLGLIVCLSFCWFNRLQTQKHFDEAASIKPAILKPPNVETPQPPSRSILKVYEKAAICSDKNTCSNIGSVILQQKGNAIDSAIASLLCNGLVTMQSMGLGGGVIMTFYKRKVKKAFSIIGRERAPFRIKLEEIKLLQNASLFAKSALSIAVPGELAAYHQAHRLYGSLPWSQIIQPTLKLCYLGYQLTRHQRDALFLNEEMIRKNELLSQMFVDFTTNLFYKEGWHIKFPPQVCATYKLLAEEGALTFYNGSLASLVVKDLNEMGSPITIEDLNNFKVVVKESVKVDLDSYYVYLPPSPGSGYVIGFIMKLLHYLKKKFSLANDFNSLEVHRIVESLKFGFVKRWQYDTDMDDMTLENMFETASIRNLTFLINDLKTVDNPQYYGSQVNLTPTVDYGTAQISVLAPNGDAVSATSSINYYFGSGRMGIRSGILFNNAMSDFTMLNFENYFNLPNIKGVNELKAQKQPMSSMAPLVVASKATGDVRLVVGAAGGSRIISTLVQILVRVLWQQQNIKQAIDAPRFHHQLQPNILEYEYGVLQQVVQALEKRGHKTQRVRRKSTAVCGVEKFGGVVQGNADYRKEAATYNSINFAISIVEKWQTSPVMTVINPQASFIKNEPFPAITICNMNQAQNSKVKDIDVKSLDYAMLKKLCFQEMDYSSFTYKQPHSENDSFANFIVKNTQSCSDMVTFCKYGHLKITCSDMFREALLDEGMCCTFNVVHPNLLYKSDFLMVRDYTTIDGPSIPLDWNPEKGYPKELPKTFYPRKPLGNGVSNGLTLILNGDCDNYYCSSTNGAGFKVALHNPIDTPNIKETGLFVSLGYQTSFVVTPSREDAAESLRILTKPQKRQCYFSDEINLHYFRHYTRRNCEMECDAKFMLQKCYCIPYHLPLLSSNVTVCHVKHFNCVVEAEKDFADQTRVKCYKECLPNCNTLSYDPKSYSVALDNRGFAVKSFYLRNFTNEDLSKYSVLKVFFPESYYRGRLKNPYMGLTEFLSQVGGLMSLMMGFSIISLVEMVYFFVMKPLIDAMRKVFHNSEVDVVVADSSDEYGIGIYPNSHLPHHIFVAPSNVFARPQLLLCSHHNGQLKYLQ